MFTTGEQRDVHEIHHSVFKSNCRFSLRIHVCVRVRIMCAYLFKFIFTVLCTLFVGMIQPEIQQLNTHLMCKYNKFYGDDFHS